MALYCRRKLRILLYFSTVILISYFILLGPYRTNNFEDQEVQRHESSAFADTMKAVSWEQFQHAFDSKDNAEIGNHATDLLHKLVPFLLSHSPVPVNNLCEAPPLQIINTTETCVPLKSPRKVGILLQFGFDVDALEIHLNELDAVVDIFFIIESVKSHGRFIRSKPLIWEKLKHDKRFAEFSDKVVHFIAGEATLAAGGANGIWRIERLQETVRWERFLEWNTVTRYFGKDDLLAFGDTDEVPDRNQVNFLKHCKLPSDPVDIGIWFPFDGTDTVFVTDFPVQGHPQTLGDPTFWTVGSAKSFWKTRGMPPSRRRGGSSRYLLGGMHLSRYAYPPFQMIKLLTATEASLDFVRKAVEVGILFSENEEEEARELMNAVPEYYIPRIEKLETFLKRNRGEADAIVKMPWFLKCNRNRFPGFDKLQDRRLDYTSS